MMKKKKEREREREGGGREGEGERGRQTNRHTDSKRQTTFRDIQRHGQTIIQTQGKKNLSTSDLSVFYDARK